jgi:hypothetical protein
MIHISHSFSYAKKKIWLKQDSLTMCIFSAVKSLTKERWNHDWDLGVDLDGVALDGALLAHFKHSFHSTSPWL